MSLLSIPDRMAERIRGPVGVMFSCGKDSLVCLDLCVRKGLDVVALCFMYFVPDLSFQQDYLRLIGCRYGVKVYQYPHIQLPRLLRAGWYSFTSYQMSDIGMDDVLARCRSDSGAVWFASGFKASDLYKRRAVVRHGFNEKRRIFYPVAGYSDKAIMSYVKLHRLPLSPTYSWGMVRNELAGDARGIALVKQYAPDDYRKIVSRFPLIEAEAVRQEKWGDPYGTRRRREPVPEICGADHKA